MDIYPFFLECSKFYDEPQKCKQLQKLAFGRGGLIFIRKKENILITERGEFIIPEMYSDDQRKNLETKLWFDTDFLKMQKNIQDARKTWINAKKKDKLRLLDKYALKQPNFQKIFQSIIKLALILKLIKIEDVSYENFEILNINGNFNENYFDE